MARKKRVDESRGMSTRMAEQRKMPVSGFRGRLWFDPERIPKGMRYRWIREASFNEPDDTNVQFRQMDGWTFVPADRHPELKIPDRPDRPSQSQSVIRRGGQILMERSERDAKMDERRLRELNIQTMMSVQWATESGLADDPRMPNFVDRNDVSVQQVATIRRE